MSNHNQQVDEEVVSSINFIIKCSEMCLSSKLCFEEKHSIFFMVQIYVI